VVVVVVTEPQAEAHRAISATAANFHMIAIYVRHPIRMGSPGK
jgi:hypothetical protein